MVNEPVKIYGTGAASIHLAVSKVQDQKVYLLWDKEGEGALHQLLIMIANFANLTPTIKEMDKKYYYSLPWNKDVEKLFTSLIEDLLNIKLSIPGALEVTFQMQLPLGMNHD